MGDDLWSAWEKLIAKREKIAELCGGPADGYQLWVGSDVCFVDIGPNKLETLTRSHTYLRAEGKEGPVDYFIWVGPTEYE